MLNFSFDSFDSIKRFVNLTSVDTLKNLYNSPLLSPCDKRIIRDAFNYANSDILEITSFNDGNTVYETYAEIHEELQNTKIIRTGFCASVNGLESISDEVTLKAITDKWLDIKNNPLRGESIS